MLELNAKTQMYLDKNSLALCEYSPSDGYLSPITGIFAPSGRWAQEAFRADVNIVKTLPPERQNDYVKFIQEYLSSDRNGRDTLYTKRKELSRKWQGFIHGEPEPKERVVTHAPVKPEGLGASKFESVVYVKYNPENYYIGL